MGLTPSHLTRAELERGCVEVIRRGRWKAGLWIANIEGNSLFIKDVRHSNPAYRWLFGRWLMWHEAHTYRQLGARDFMPRLVARIDGDAFALELVEGTHLGRCEASMRTPELFDRIQACVRELHELGAVHLDLRSRRNIFITPDGRPMLVDFGNALFFGRGWIAQNIIVPALAWIDDSAIRKFRSRDLIMEASRPQRAFDLLRRIIWPWPRIWRAMGINRSLKRNSMVSGGANSTTAQRSAAMPHDG